MQPPIRVYPEQIDNHQYQFDSLKPVQVWGYAIGHFFNDLTGIICYLLFYLKEIKKQESIAPYAMLAGQISDAVAVIVVGILSDRYETRWGKRIPWYIGGIVLEALSFLPIFLSILPSDSSDLEIYIYYIIFPCVYAIGWAAVQVPHMMLVPSITCSRKKRDELNGKRNTFAFFANFLILGLALLFFQFCSSELSFIYLCIVAYGAGLLSSFFFLYTIREVPLTQTCQNYVICIKQQLEAIQISNQQLADTPYKNKEVENQRVSWKYWFKKPLFYQCGVIYVGAKFYCNILSTMLNFYLIHVLQYSTQQELEEKTPIQIAIIPLSLYVTSVAFSSKIDRLLNLLGRKGTFLLGALFSLGTTIELLIIDVDDKQFIYIVTVFIGVSQALLVNTGVTMINDVIGIKGQSGAFVFGCYSFLDKLSSGIALFVITIMPQFKDSDEFIRYTTSIVPEIAVIIALIFVILQKTQDANINEKDQLPKSRLEIEFAQ